MPRARAECRNFSQPQWDIFELSKIRLSKLRFRFRWDITGVGFDFKIDGDSESDETGKKIEDIGFEMYRRATSTDLSSC